MIMRLERSQDQDGDRTGVEARLERRQDWGGGRTGEEAGLGGGRGIFFFFFFFFIYLKLYMYMGMPKHKLALYKMHFDTAYSESKSGSCIQYTAAVKPSFD